MFEPLMTTGIVRAGVRVQVRVRVKVRVRVRVSVTVRIRVRVRVRFSAGLSQYLIPRPAGLLIVTLNHQLA